MKTLLLVLVFAVLGVAPAAAQSSASCSAPTLSGTVTVTSSVFTFSACVPAAEQVDGITLEVNGVKSFPTSTPEAPNASGKVAFPLTVTLPSRGNYTIRTYPYTLRSDGSRQEGASASAPFVLAFEKAVPTTAPTNHPR